MCCVDDRPMVRPKNIWMDAGEEAGEEEINEDDDSMKENDGKNSCDGDNSDDVDDIDDDDVSHLWCISLSERAFFSY